MRALAAFLLLSLLAAFHAPLVAAAADPAMDCCAGGMTQMCCPPAGSRSMRSCRADEQEALLSTMGVFLVPARAAAARPAPVSLVPTASAHPPVSEAFPVPDPPPRG